MAASSDLTKIEVIAAGVSFASIFAMGVVGKIALIAGVDQKTADAITYSGILFFFCVFGFALIGLMLHAFVALQLRIGNGRLPMVRFLAAHETGVTFSAWGFLSLGALIAIPFALQDTLEFQWPLAASKGELVADIGMTIDEVKARSTVKVKEPLRMGDGSYLGSETMVFDYRLGDSAVHFPQSRYYWLTTPIGDRHINALNMGITPRKMPKTELDAFEYRIQTELLADGWMPGHYLAKSEETVRMWGGKRTTGDGRYWLKGNTVLIFERNRMDEEKRGEPPGTGEFILYLDLRAKESEPELVFERSAWVN